MYVFYYLIIYYLFIILIIYYTKFMKVFYYLLSNLSNWKKQIAK